jgi:Ca2+-binding RTX toxin-like protein
MATVNFYQSINMSNPRIFYGSVTNATSSSITINNYMGQSGTYNGSFSYSGNNLAGGTVTGYQSVDNYSLSATVTGVSVNALTLKSYLDTGNALGLYQYALSGADQITGSSGSDTLLGFNGNDTLNGGNGADNLYGGLGNDTYVVDNADDVVTENAGAGTDTVKSSITYTLTDNVENLTLIGTTALNGTGNGLKNILTGNAAANSLNGGAGADKLIGGLGNDTYFVDNTGDAVTENAGAGTDTVNSSITYTLTANVEKLTLTGTTALNGTGNALNNTLTGNTAANRLNGGAGADKLIGGLGNDTYIVDNTGDVVTENTGAGTDTVNSSITYTLTANVENLTLTGTTALNGTGNALNNTLSGNVAANRLNGGAGNDTILGLAGNDFLTGGNGTDKLTGGAGADTFDFNALIESTKGTARDSITDFTHNQADKIDLAGIDANRKVAGDQGFSYIGAKAFTGVAGQLDYLNGILAGDTNGDKIADFEIAITLVGSTSLVSADFVL